MYLSGINVLMFNKCIKLFIIVNGVYWGKGRIIYYIFSEVVYWDFVLSSKISFWWRFVCLIILDLWFI